MLKKIGKKISPILKDETVLINAVWIILAILLGTVVRLNFISGTDYPVNDGGLFYQMVEDLQENKYIIPRYTLYNQDEIPFAYPPLAFFFIAILNVITNISLMSLLRYFPTIISVITILAFYFLSREIIKDQILVGISTVFFAVVPRAFEWFVMGGGITRALGFLFAILAIQAIWQMYEKNNGWGVVLKAAIYSGMTVLSHPETALFVVFTALALILYHGITKARILKSIWVAAGVLLVISPWIISIVRIHGLAPFVSAGGTGHDLWFEIKNLITLKFGFENGEFLSVFSGLAIIAVLIRKDKLTWSLFGMLVLGYVFFPRSGPNLLTIWVSLLAAIGLKEILLLSAKMSTQTTELSDVIVANGKVKIILILLIMYLFLGAYTYKFIYGKDKLHLTNDIREAFIWIDENTAPGTSFMIYPSVESNRFWWNDYLSEWFPVIARRQSVTTVQGYEWIPELFEQKIFSYVYLRTCDRPGPVCVENWEKYNNQEIDFLVIDTDDERPDFVNSFGLNDDYTVFYENDRLVVFAKK